MKKQLNKSLDSITDARRKLEKVKDLEPAAEIKTAITKLDEAFMWIERFLAKQEG